MNASNTFFISDFHFDHTNIIRYCNRPFNSTQEMNEVMLRNYRRVVRPDSTVFFLGDMSFGRNSRPAEWWLRQLPGDIIYIKGSHDRDMDLSDSFVLDHYILNVGGIEFFLVHDYHNAPPDWIGWVIHGHKHGNRPFVDRTHRRINVSVEVVNYTPVSLARILGTI